MNVADEHLRGYKVDTVAKMLDCSRAHVYNMIGRGEIRSVKIGGSRRIPAMELSRLLYGEDSSARRPQFEQRQAVPSRVRRLVIERDGRTCQICGGTVDDWDRHLDHIIPVSHGGKHDVDNLRVTHAACNLKRGNRTHWHGDDQ